MPWEIANSVSTRVKMPVMLSTILLLMRMPVWRLATVVYFNSSSSSSSSSHACIPNHLQLIMVIRQLTILPQRYWRSDVRKPDQSLSSSSSYL